MNNELGDLLFNEPEIFFSDKKNVGSFGKPKVIQEYKFQNTMYKGNESNFAIMLEDNAANSRLQEIGNDYIISVCENAKWTRVRKTYNMAT